MSAKDVFLRAAVGNAKDIYLYPEGGDSGLIVYVRSGLMVRGHSVSSGKTIEFAKSAVPARGHALAAGKVVDHLTAAVVARGHGLQAGRLHEHSQGGTPVEGHGVSGDQRHEHAQGGASAEGHTASGDWKFEVTRGGTPVLGYSASGGAVVTVGVVVVADAQTFPAIFEITPTGLRIKTAPGRKVRIVTIEQRIALAMQQVQFSFVRPATLALKSVWGFRPNPPQGLDD